MWELKDGALLPEAWAGWEGMGVTHRYEVSFVGNKNVLKSVVVTATQLCGTLSALDLTYMLNVEVTGQVNQSDNAARKHC